MMKNKLIIIIIIGVIGFVITNFIKNNEFANSISIIKDQIHNMDKDINQLKQYILIIDNRISELSTGDKKTAKQEKFFVTIFKSKNLEQCRKLKNKKLSKIKEIFIYKDNGYFITAAGFFEKKEKVYHLLEQLKNNGFGVNLKIEKTTEPDKLNIIE